MLTTGGGEVEAGGLRVWCLEVRGVSWRSKVKEGGNLHECFSLHAPARVFPGHTFSFFKPIVNRGIILIKQPAPLCK